MWTVLVKQETDEGKCKKKLTHDVFTNNKIDGDYPKDEHSG